MRKLGKASRNSGSCSSGARSNPGGNSASRIQRGGVGALGQFLRPAQDGPGRRAGKPPPDQREDARAIRHIQQQGEKETVLHAGNLAAHRDEAVAADDLGQRRLHVFRQCAVLFGENLPDPGPLARITQMAHPVLQDEKRALKIESSHHLLHEIAVGGITRLLQHIEQLLAAQGQRIIAQRVEEPHAAAGR